MALFLLRVPRKACLFLLAATYIVHSDDVFCKVLMRTDRHP